MGIWSWMLGKKEAEPPPEPLVFGAKLHCEYGSQDTYLMVASDNISVNNLPKACVEDSKTPENIQPFGTCLQMNVPCKSVISLEDKWINVQPQNARVNGKEIITTKSTITCNFAGRLIQAKTSGQDNVYINELIFMAEMDTKYKALNEVLDNPYGSLYLNEGVYELALQFLEERVNRQGGSIPLTSLYSGAVTRENLYIREVMGRLLLGCDVEDRPRFVSEIINAATMHGMGEEPGFNTDYLNAAMLELIARDSRASAERIKKGGLPRLFEKHKKGLENLETGVNMMTYVAVGYTSGVSQSIKNGGNKNAKTDAKKTEEGSKANGSKGQKNSTKIEGEEVNKGGSGSPQGNKEPYIPKDGDGNPIPLAKQKVNGQDIPLPDPEATGPHTVLGGKVSSETGQVYRQSATFPKGTYPPANGKNVPWSEVNWTNHGRGDHPNPHQHIFEYNPDKGGWIRGGPSYFKD